MKKERNAFFQNQSASSMFYPSNNMPFAYPQMTNSSSNFYQGPILDNNSFTNEYSNEIETRLAKIERQINRLDSRITKLESESTNFDYNSSNNMYMV